MYWPIICLFSDTNLGNINRFSDVLTAYTIGSFRNDDGDGSENVTKAIGLDWQNNNFARASRFFVHFFVVPARLRRENA